MKQTVYTWRKARMVLKEEDDAPSEDMVDL